MARRATEADQCLGEVNLELPGNVADLGHLEPGGTPGQQFLVPVPEVVIACDRGLCTMEN